MSCAASVQVSAWNEFRFHRLNNRLNQSAVGNHIYGFVIGEKNYFTISTFSFASCTFTVPVLQIEHQAQLIRGDPEIRLWGLQTDMEACFWPKNSETSFWKLSLYKLVDWRKTKYNNHSCINSIFMGGYLRIWASKNRQHKKNNFWSNNKKALL